MTSTNERKDVIIDHSLVDFMLRLKDLFNLYRFIGINESDFYNIVKKEITSKSEVNIDYNKVYNKVQKILVSKTKELINNENTFYDMIKNYIDLMGSNVNSAHTALSFMNGLGNVFQMCQFNVSLEMLINLLTNNERFNYFVKLIYDAYYKEINETMLERVFNNDFLVLVINSYLIKHNIFIQEKTETEEEDDYDELINNSLKYYIRSIKYIKVLSKEEEKALVLKINEGDNEAREFFIVSNLRLVVSIAKRYLGRGLEFLDLIQDGNEGLLKAIGKFDINKGYRFSTFAYFYIRESILRAIDNMGRNVKIPVYLQDRIRNYTEVKNKLELKLNREPRLEEIALCLGTSINELQNLLKYLGDTVSLNETVNSDNNSKREEEDNQVLADIVSVQEDSIESQVISSLLNKELLKLFYDSHLSEREITVMVFRYGLDGKDPMTYEDIGKILNISRQGATRIEAVALKKIRSSEHVEAFAIYMSSPAKALEQIADFRSRYSERSNINNTFLRERKKKTVVVKEEVKLKTIYDFFLEFTKEEVNEIIDGLTSYDKEILRKKYGEDLENPIATKISHEDNQYFYNSLVRKIERRLIKLRKNRVLSSEVVVSEKSVSEDTDILQLLKNVIFSENDDDRKLVLI